MKPIKLFWSRGTGRQRGRRNAGDWFSPRICEELSGRPVVYAPPRRCDMVAVGSVLHRMTKSHPLHRLGFHRSVHVWGTGSLRESDRLDGSHHVHAIRGQLTRERIAAAAADAPLGDPGLLAELLIDPPPVKRHALGLIPHMVDQNDPAVERFLERNPHVTRIDITWPVRDVLRTIAACERMLSSSLHGLVFADAFDVPNAWFTVGDRVLCGRHKFDDYYSAFGLRLEPVHLDRICLENIGTDYARPGIAELKLGLAAAFPCS